MAISEASSTARTEAPRDRPALRSQRAGDRHPKRHDQATLGVGERQRMEIFKALHRGATVVLLDEPTAVLVTHELDEVFAVADEITVLRYGRVALSAETAATSRAAVTAATLGGWMVGG